MSTAWQFALRIFYLAPVACVLLLALNTVSVAQQEAEDEFVAEQELPSNPSLMCSLYRVSGELESRISNTDGSKLYKRDYWNQRLLNLKIKGIKRKIRRFRAISGKEGKVTKLKRSKKKFSRAKRSLRACRLTVQVTPTPTPNPDRVLFSDVEPIIEADCMVCHRALGWENNEDFFLDSGRVVRGDLENSPFYTFLSNNPEGYLPAYMPKGLPALPQEEIALIAMWIVDLLEPSPSPSSSPSPDPSADPSASPSPTPPDPVVEGTALYDANCASCHNPLSLSTKWAASEEDIRAALAAGGVAQMQYLNLSDQEISYIAAALASVVPPIEGTLSIQDAQILEGDLSDGSVVLDFEVRLTGNASEAFTVGYAISNGSALADSDYLFSSGTIDFTGIENEVVNIQVPILGDTFEEADEIFFVDIGNVSYYRVTIEDSSAVGTIVNDDLFVEQQVLPPAIDTLRFAYSFDTGFGDSINGHHALSRGEPQIVAESVYGPGALALDGVDDSLQIPEEAFAGAESLTVAAWVYWDGGEGRNSRIFSFGESNQSFFMLNPDFSASSDDRCRLYFRVFGDQNYTINCSAGQLQRNRWTHIAAVLDADNLRMFLYLDGNLIGSRSVGFDASDLDGFSQSFIGKSQVDDDPLLPGSIDEFYVYSSVLSQAEIIELMNMDERILINPGFEVWHEGIQLLNGELLDLGNVETGQELYTSLFLGNSGAGTAQLLDSPSIRILGPDADEFEVEYLPLSWQQMIGQGPMISAAFRYAPRNPGGKQATLTIANSDQRNGNFAAAIVASASGESLPDSGSGGGGDDATLILGQQLYGSFCASCHGALASSSKLGASLDQISTALASGGVPQMQGFGLSVDQVEAIALALNSAGGGSSSEQVELIEEAILPIGTASYVKSVLESIFLPDNSADYNAEDIEMAEELEEYIMGNTASGDIIRNRRAMFGGRSERFAPFYQFESVTVTQQPPLSAARSALIDRVCSDLLTRDRAVETALQKVSLSSSQELSPERVALVYELFFPDKVLAPHLQDLISTHTVGMPVLSSVDEWRSVLYMFCNSTDWEVL